MAPAVLRGVEADDRARGHLDLAVDDGPADPRVAVDRGVGHEDGVLDVAERVHAHARARGSMRRIWLPETMHPEDTIESVAHPAAPVLGEDELGGRELRLVRAQRPLRVVEVEDGVDLR